MVESLWLRGDEQTVHEESDVRSLGLLNPLTLSHYRLEER